MPVQIFLSGRQSAADVPLRFIDIEHLPGFCRKRGLDLHQAVGDILMYRALADSKMFCRLPHRRIIINDISGDFHRSFLYIAFQKNPLPYLFLHCMQGISGLEYHLFYAFKCSRFFHNLLPRLVLFLRSLSIFAILDAP